MTERSLPRGAQIIFRTLLGAGYECYLVGGSVRDALLGGPGADLDFTTNARPRDLLRLFRHSYYPNAFGTVLVNLGGAQYEITTYRGEGRYSDRRHPDEVHFVDRLQDDLMRRDFTVNAMAMDVHCEVIDPFGGRADLERRLIRAVGDPAERLTEDPLRMMRAARFATQLCFSIEQDTWQAIATHAALLSVISRERVRDELLKILASDHPLTGIDFLDHLQLLPDILPELAAAQRLNQPPAQRFNLYHHALQSLHRCYAALAVSHFSAIAGDSAADGIHASSSPEVSSAYAGNGTREALIRLAALLHVLAEVPAAADAAPVPSGAIEHSLQRLRLSNTHLERVRTLITGIAAVPEDLPSNARSARGLLSAYGDLLPDLLRVVEAHRWAAGIPAEQVQPEQLTELRRLAIKVGQEQHPLKLADLAVTGADLMQALDLPPGKTVGRLLRLLLARVLDEPRCNTRAALLEIATSEIKGGEWP
ncbi:MAG: CCA tRNA nucleotidyltransferase [Dehalococcoidia bacterium]